MRRAGFDAYYIDSLDDSRTCGTCKAISKRSHEEPFRFEDARPGENYPPLHPRCRCEVNPAVDSWAGWMRGGTGRRQDREKIAERFGVNSPTVLGKKGRSVSGLPDPELVDGERFDPNSSREVRRFIRKYAALIKDFEVEHVYILDANGRVWHAIGNGENVSCGGVELEGARVLHNHPTIDGERVSFGADDFQMLKTYSETAALFAVNDTFLYSVKPNASIQGVSYNEAYRNADFDRLLNGEEQQLLVRGRGWMNMDTLTIDGRIYEISDEQAKLIEQAREESLSKLDSVMADRPDGAVLGGAASTISHKCGVELAQRVREIVLGGGAVARK